MFKTHTLSHYLPSRAETSSCKHVFPQAGNPLKVPLFQLGDRAWAHTEEKEEFLRLVDFLIGTLAQNMCTFSRQNI